MTQLSAWLGYGNKTNSYYVVHMMGILSTRSLIFVGKMFEKCKESGGNCELPSVLCLKHFHTKGKVEGHVSLSSGG